MTDDLDGNIMTTDQLKNLRAQVDTELEKRDTPEAQKAKREKWMNKLNTMSDREFNQRMHFNKGWDDLNHDGK